MRSWRRDKEPGRRYRLSEATALASVVKVRRQCGSRTGADDHGIAADDRGDTCHSRHRRRNRGGRNGMAAGDSGGRAAHAVDEGRCRRRRRFSFRLRLSHMSVLSGGFKTIRGWDSASSRATARSLDSSACVVARPTIQRTLGEKRMTKDEATLIASATLDEAWPMVEYFSTIPQKRFRNRPPSRSVQTPPGIGARRNGRGLSGRARRREFSATRRDQVGSARNGI